MTRSVFEYSSEFPFSSKEVFDWHKKESAFQRLSPPWDEVRIIERSNGIEKGARTVIDVRIWPFWKRWIAEHTSYTEGTSFTDTQVTGPFAYWQHEHKVSSITENTCSLTDHIEYTLPLGLLGKIFASGMIKQKLDRMFRYRHSILLADLQDSVIAKESLIKNVVVVGASGFVGTNLCAYFDSIGLSVKKVGRKKSTTKDIAFWDPIQGDPNPEIFENADAVVHLAGESIAEGLWTNAKKKRIRDSRVLSTESLCKVLSSMKKPPKVFLCASGTGIYGDRKDELLDENSSHGKGFLTDVAEEWENACARAVESGIRVVNMRFGIVMSPAGGALKSLLIPFRLRMGEYLGNASKAYMGWIGMDDLLAGIRFCMQNEKIMGPVNFVSPNPVTNHDFIDSLEKVMDQRTFLPVPSFLLKLFMGQKAKELLLASTRAYPKKLIDQGFNFRHPTIDVFLKHILGL